MAVVQVLELTSQILYREKEHTRAILEDLVAYDTGYLFTNDEEYLESHGSMQPMWVLLVEEMVG